MWRNTVGVRSSSFITLGAIALAVGAGCGPSSSASVEPTELDAGSDMVVVDRAVSSGDAAKDAAKDAGVGRNDYDGACLNDPVEGLPDFCDDGVRQEVTGNDWLNQFLKLTPEDCVEKGSNTVFTLDSETDDPDYKRPTSICKLKGAYYWVSDLDVDCDGQPTPGKCGKDLDKWFQPDTSLHTTKNPDLPLAAGITPYLVVPEPRFGAPADIKLGTLGMIIYRDRWTYAVFADTIPATIIGEASYAAAEKLGIPPSAINGGAIGKVATFIVFTGDQALPKDNEDQDEARELGERLANGLLEANK